MISWFGNFFATAARNLGPTLSTVLLLAALVGGAFLIFKAIQDFTKKSYKEAMLYLLFAAAVFVAAYAFGSNGGLFNAAGQAVSVTDPMQLVS